MQFVAANTKIWWNNKRSSFLWNTVYIQQMHTHQRNCVINRVGVVKKGIWLKLLLHSRKCANLHDSSNFQKTSKCVKRHLSATYSDPLPQKARQQPYVTTIYKYWNMTVRACSITTAFSDLPPLAWNQNRTSLQKLLTRNLYFKYLYRW